MLDVYHARKFHKLLGTVLERYEKEFGKIAKPKAIAKAEKQNEKNASKRNKVPNYSG